MTAPRPSMAHALALYRRWQEGDAAAREEFAAEIQPWLHAEFQWRLGTTPRAAIGSVDLAQDAVLRLVKDGPKFHFENELKLKGMLRKWVRNDALDFRRENGRRPDDRHLESVLQRTPSGADISCPDQSKHRPMRLVEHAEDADLVRKAMAFLDPSDRRLVIAALVEDVSWADVARQLGLPSADAARIRCSRLMPTLLRHMRELQLGRKPPRGADS